MKRYRNPSDHLDMIECPDGNWVELEDVVKLATTLLTKLEKADIIRNRVDMIHAAIYMNELIFTPKEKT